MSDVKVPEGWSLKTINEVCDIAIGGTPSRAIAEYWDAEKATNNLWVSIRDLNTTWIYETSEHITDLGVKNSNVKLVKKGTVLMSFKLSVGRVAYAGRDLYTNEAIVAFLPKAKNILSNQFLYQGLQQWNLLENIDQAVKGITLNKEKINQIEALLPPLPEQQKIATILTSVDTVIEKTRAQIDKLKHLKTAMMQELLTKGIGHTEFKDSPVGKIPKTWEVKEIGEIATQVKPGPFGSSLTKAMYTKTGYKIYGQEQVISGDFKVGDYYIDQEKYDELSAFKVAAGDVLISLVGTFGQIAVVPDNFEHGVINPRLLIVRFPLNKINTAFIAQQLKSEHVLNQLKQLQQGGTMGVLSATTVKPVKLVIPSIEQQHLIANALQSIDNKIAATSQKLKSLEKTKKALMQDLLTGTVRVDLS